MRLGLSQHTPKATPLPGPPPGVSRRQGHLSGGSPRTAAGAQPGPGLGAGVGGVPGGHHMGAVGAVGRSGCEDAQCLQRVASHITRHLAGVAATSEASGSRRTGRLVSPCQPRLLHRLLPLLHPVPPACHATAEGRVAMGTGVGASPVCPGCLLGSPAPSQTLCALPCGLSVRLWAALTGSDTGALPGPPGWSGLCPHLCLSPVCVHACILGFWGLVGWPGRSRGESPVFLGKGPVEGEASQVSRIGGQSSGPEDRQGAATAWLGRDLS